MAMQALIHLLQTPSSCDEMATDSSFHESCHHFLKGERDGEKSQNEGYEHRAA